jgi:hypothetical protein
VAFEIDNRSRLLGSQFTSCFFGFLRSLFFFEEIFFVVPIFARESDRFHNSRPSWRARLNSAGTLYDPADEFAAFGFWCEGISPKEIR